MCSLINKQLLLTAYAYLFTMGQQKEQQGSEALQLQVEESHAVLKEQEVKVTHCGCTKEFKELGEMELKDFGDCDRCGKEEDDGVGKAWGCPDADPKCNLAVCDDCRSAGGSEVAQYKAYGGTRFYKTRTGRMEEGGIADGKLLLALGEPIAVETQSGDHATRVAIRYDGGEGYISLVWPVSLRPANPKAESQLDIIKSIQMAQDESKVMGPVNWVGLGKKLLQEKCALPADRAACEALVVQQIELQKQIFATKTGGCGDKNCPGGCHRCMGVH